MFGKKLLDESAYRQVSSVAYGPLVGEWENSVDEYSHDYILLTMLLTTLQKDILTMITVMICI